MTDTKYNWVLLYMEANFKWRNTKIIHDKEQGANP